MDQARAAERARIERARNFAEKWAGRGYEKGDTHSFWLELLRDVVGMGDVTTNVRFERATAERGFIDAVIPGSKTFIEQKSLGSTSTRLRLDKALKLPRLNRLNGTRTHCLTLSDQTE